MRKITSRIVRAGIVALAFAGALSAEQSSLSVQDHCDMALKSARLVELQWRERLSTAQAHEGTSRALDAKIRTIDERYDRVKSQVYSQYGMTFQEFLRYGADHQSAIRLYLDKNSEVKSALDSSASVVQGLRSQMEALMTPVRSGGGQNQ
jgi:hypothetical protein